MTRACASASGRGTGAAAARPEAETCGARSALISAGFARPGPGLGGGSHSGQNHSDPRLSRNFPQGDGSSGAGTEKALYGRRRNDASGQTGCLAGDLESRSCGIREERTRCLVRCISMPEDDSGRGRASTLNASDLRCSATRSAILECYRFNKLWKNQPGPACKGLEELCRSLSESFDPRR